MASTKIEGYIRPQELQNELLARGHSRPNAGEVLKQMVDHKHQELIRGHGPGDFHQWSHADGTVGWRFIFDPMQTVDQIDESLLIAIRMGKVALCNTSRIKLGSGGKYEAIDPVLDPEAVTRCVWINRLEAFLSNYDTGGDAPVSPTPVADGLTTAPVCDKDDDKAIPQLVHRGFVVYFVPDIGFYRWRNAESVGHNGLDNVAAAMADIDNYLRAKEMKT